MAVLANLSECTVPVLICTADIMPMKCFYYHKCLILAQMFITVATMVYGKSGGIFTR